MRCPKCGFISFDDLTSCSKCTNDIADLTEEIHGTCTGAEVGFFLGAVVKALDMDTPADFTSEVTNTTQQSFDASQQLDFNETFSGEIPFSLEEDGDVQVAAPAGDDVEIELGEVLPLDFSQLESGEEEQFDVTLETSVAEIGIDLSDTDEEETLSLDAEGLDLANVPELDLTGAFDQTVPGETGDTQEAKYTDNLGQIDEELEAHAEQLQSVNLENLDLSDLIAEPEDAEGESFDQTVDIGDLADEADQTSEIKLTPEDIGDMTIDDSSIELDTDDVELFESTLETAAVESAEFAVEGLDDLVIEEPGLDEGEMAADGDDFVDLSTLVDDAAEPSDSTQMLTRDELDLDQLSDDAGPAEGEVTQQLDIDSLPDGELIPEEVELSLDDVELDTEEELFLDEEELTIEEIEPVSAAAHEETAGMPMIELVAEDGDDDDVPPEIPDLP